FEREFGADDRPKRAIVESSVDRCMDVGRFGFGNRPEGEGANGGAARHKITRRDGYVPAAADDDDAAVLGKKFEIGSEIDVGEHFENDVDALPRRGFEDLVLVVGL